MALVRGTPTGLVLGPISTERLKNKLKVRARSITPLVASGIEARGESLFRALLTLRAERVGSFILAVSVISRIPRIAGFIAALWRRGRVGTTNLMRTANAHDARGVGAVRVRSVAVPLRRVAVRRRAGPAGAKHGRRLGDAAVARPFRVARRRPIPAPRRQSGHEERTGKHRGAERRDFFGDLIHLPRMQRRCSPVLRSPCSARPQRRPQLTSLPRWLACVRRRTTGESATALGARTGNGGARVCGGRKVRGR